MGKLKVLKFGNYKTRLTRTITVNTHKEEARLDRTLCPVQVQIFFLSTKDIKANELVTIMLNLMDVPLFCTEDSYFTCNLGKKEPKLTFKPMETGKVF